MTDRYLLADAARDLASADLLRGLVTASANRWRTQPIDGVTGGFHGAVLDSRQARPDMLFVGLPGSRTDGRRFAASALAAGAHALVGPGSGGAIQPSDDAPAAGTVLVSDDPLAALTHLAGCWRRTYANPVIGVTGSNGKTTTKDLLAALLGGAGPVHATGGNLNSAQGVPVTVLGLAPWHRHAIIEMGASAVGHIAARAAVARPAVGVITNAAPAHLEEFGSLEAIIEGKGELVAALPTDGTAVLNADSPGFQAWCDRAPCPVVSWGGERGDHRWTWVAGDGDPPGWLFLDGTRWPVPLPGRHNGANLCAAILAARAVGVDDATLRRGLIGFHASDHRGDLRRLAGRLVLDDSYNANPDSMVTAVGALLDLSGGPAVAVLGAMAELGPASEVLHQDCGRRCAEAGLARLIAVGPGAEPLAVGFAAAGGHADTVADHAAAADLLAVSTAPGDRVLVKGSRSAAMETVLAELTDRHGWTPEDGS
jgi:UDP-N-acetylmuramoyl-tripeptide--D-alanyl-D-alanine ligase